MWVLTGSVVDPGPGLLAGSGYGEKNSVSGSWQLRIRNELYLDSRHAN